MDLTGAVWRTSTRSDNGGSTCVEVATNLPEVVGVRDSKDRQGPVLSFRPAAWAAFTGALVGGRFTADTSNTSRRWAPLRSA
ncbi:DUF397 domain-containing protein [Micromonospora sagamiensis]|uniref:Uncharacterized protein DUF397 n=1 Tax=Micromonospora sagamiensis TaxID=47875 RepID=A0A562WK84_9ACTN|nr:DUF397 domain-containing protein [Micromonospora sagamiensis]TWJ30703.1 uncharacterized protein DUF397 [Micromonospora sagamiensis]BCL16262.1 hypothetical protein GCM10017556_40010 [Micromonospora sagamiensis]